MTEADHDLHPRSRPEGHGVEPPSETMGVPQQSPYELVEVDHSSSPFPATPAATAARSVFVHGPNRCPVRRLSTVAPS